MATTLSITPNRFIAGGGKLDSFNGYIAKTSLGDETFFFINGPTIMPAIVYGYEYGWSYSCGAVSWSVVGQLVASFERMRALY